MKCRGLLSERGTLQATKAPIAAGGGGWSAHLFVANRKQNAMRDSENGAGVFELGAPRRAHADPRHLPLRRHRHRARFRHRPERRVFDQRQPRGDHNVLVFRIDRKTGRLTRTQALPLNDQPAFVHPGMLRR
jgi:hypothetical protein